MTQFEITRRGKQRGGASFDHGAKRVKPVRIVGEFHAIPAPKLGKALGPVPIPLAQRGRRRQFSRPCIEF